MELELSRIDNGMLYELSVRQFDNNSQITHLQGVIVHRGSPDAGHYWAYVRQTHPLLWYRLDDDRISLTSFYTMYLESVGSSEYHDLPDFTVSPLLMS